MPRVRPGDVETGRSGRGRWASRALLGLLVIGVGCGERDLPGHYWDVDLSTDRDECNSPAVGVSDSLTYRLDIELATVTLAIGADPFASGEIDGCTVTYESVTWTTPRDAGDVQWTLSGQATAQRGDGSCGTPADWIGTETFTVVSSEDPAIRPGCEFTLNVTGTYVGEVL